MAAALEQVGADVVAAVRRTARQRGQRGRAEPLMGRSAPPLGAEGGEIRAQGLGGTSGATDAQETRTTIYEEERQPLHLHLISGFSGPHRADMAP